MTGLLAGLRRLRHGGRLAGVVARERLGGAGLSVDASMLADDRRDRYLPVDEPCALRAAAERDPAVLADIAGPFILAVSGD